MTDEVKLFKQLTGYKYSMLKANGLDLTKSYILYLLYHRNKLYPADIIDEINIKPQALANILNSMQEDKLITRDISSSDKRKIAILLTEKGKIVGSKHCKEELSKIKDLTDYLGDEDTKNLIRIFERMRKYAEKI